MTRSSPAPAIALASLLAIVGTTAACSKSGEATGWPSESSAASSGEASAIAASGVFCANGSPSLTSLGGGAQRVITAHYDLYAEAAPELAIDLGRLLEASRAALSAWFEASPRLAIGERLRVRLLADEAAWIAALAADGITAPAEAGGYFSPATRAAYLFTQKNPYYTRVLLLHEATHQHHELSRAQGPKLPFWYREGHAEYLSRHDWDGRCVKLGITPTLSWEDLPAKALAEAHAGIDLAGVVSGKAPASRAAAWAIFGFLDQGAHRLPFKAFRDAFDASPGDAARAFTAHVGDPRALSAPLAAWIAGRQEPMRPVFTEWIHRGPGSVIADSPAYFSLAIVKDPVTRFEASYEAPRGAGWSAGVVLGFDDEQHYTALVVSPDQRVRTFTAKGELSIWRDVGAAPSSLGDGTGAISADFQGNGVAQVTVNGAAHLVSTGSLAPRAGLAVNDVRVRFFEVRWR